MKTFFTRWTTQGSLFTYWGPIISLKEASWNFESITTFALLNMTYSTWKFQNFPLRPSLEKGRKRGWLSEGKCPYISKMPLKRANQDRVKSHIAHVIEQTFLYKTYYATIFGNSEENFYYETKFFYRFVPCCHMWPRASFPNEEEWFQIICGLVVRSSGYPNM